MAATQAPEDGPRVVEIPGRRLRRLATKLMTKYPLANVSSTDLLASSCPVRVVCISDTHNRQPELPPGDVLIHAGDLTENGSFEEVQKQLDWLQSQSHRYKIMIAGNHDVLLDEKFLEAYPRRRYERSETMKDLNWGDIIYLNDSYTTLNFPPNNIEAGNKASTRTLTIYGNPTTPQYGVSAFQIPRAKDIWNHRIRHNTNIVICHGPPHLYLDSRDFHRAGCPFFAHEIARIRPRLVVFGHIHASYGREDVVFSSVRQSYDDIMRGWAAWGALAQLVIGIVIAQMWCFIWSRKKVLEREKVTTLVNASVVGKGLKNELMNYPVVVDI